MSKNFGKGPIKSITSDADAIKARILIALGDLSPDIYTRVKRVAVLRRAGVSDEDGAPAISELDAAKALSFNEGQDDLRLEYVSNKRRVGEAAIALKQWKNANKR